MARTRGNRGANADCGKQENIIFAKNLTGYLNEAGIQSAEFAKMCGVCPSTMSDYLNANKSPKLSTAIKIACSLGASLDDLCGIENGEKNGGARIPQHCFNAKAFNKIRHKAFRRWDF